MQKQFNFSQIAASANGSTKISSSVDASRIRNQIKQLIVQDWKEKCVEEWKKSVQASSSSLEKYVQCVTSIFETEKNNKEDPLLLGLIGQCEEHHNQLQTTLKKLNSIFSNMKQIILQCKQLCNSIPETASFDKQFDEWHFVQILEQWCDMYNLELQSKELIFISLIESISDPKELQTLLMYCSSWRHEPYLSINQIQQWETVLQWDKDK